jgi:hypothetical protein
MRIIPLLCAAILVGTLSVAQTSKPLSAFDQQLIDQQKQFLHAIESKDASAVERAVADDFQGIAVNGDFYDRGEVVDSASEGVPQGTRTYDFHVVKLNNDSAVVAYNLIVPGAHPRYRHMADTWAKVDGQWKLKFRQISLNLWSAGDLD